MASRKDQHMRLLLAQEAARILLDSGSRDFALAKRKAAEHLSAHDTRQMPSNLEIEQAVAEYQRLFRSQSQPQHLQQLREDAYEAMQFFQDFDPRLVGPVLSGTADINTTISLHVFTDTPEEISLLLLDQHIPFETGEKRLRLREDTYQIFPTVSFLARQNRIEVIIFPVSKRVPTPLSPVDGRPVQRANLASVEMLLNEDVAQSDLIGG
ncbi:MAG: hypothetical protein GC149_11575 [Gammaproteobacteria bacterium]|nr:hypothetical protein [Gammaproteobacteria bacterium]